MIELYIILKTETKLRFASTCENTTKSGSLKYNKKNRKKPRISKNLATSDVRINKNSATSAALT